MLHKPIMLHSASVRGTAEHYPGKLYSDTAMTPECVCVSSPGTGHSPLAQIGGETLKKNDYFYVCFMAHFSH